MNQAKIIYDETSDGLEISDLNELDQLLDQVHLAALNTLPTIVSVEMNNTLIYIGLGLKLSFVHLLSVSNESPYLATVGDINLKGSVDFYFHGSHHTEIQRKNLIPIDKARFIVQKFYQTGIKPENITWEEV